MKKILPGIFLPVLIIGCASAPPLQEAALLEPVPELRLQQADTLRADWWRDFKDSTLDSVIAELQRNSFNLQAAAARLDMALAQARVNGADVFPSISAGVSATRSRQNLIGFPIPSAKNGILTIRSNSFGISTNISWELDLWGRVRSARSAALANAQAAGADYAAAWNSLIGQTAKAWFAAIEAQRQVELAESTLSVLKTSREQIYTRYSRGLRPSLDYILAKSNVAAAEAVLQQRRQILEQVQRQLELLLGRYPAAEISIAKSLPEPEEDIPAGIPVSLLLRRPDVIAAERRLAAAGASLKQARAALFPRISLSAGGGTTTKEFSDLLNSDLVVWSLASNLLQPIFQGGRLRATVALMSAQQRLALAQYSQSALTAYTEVENALASVRYLSRQEEALRVATEEALESRRLAEQRYNTGLADLITVLEAQRRAYDAESQLLRIRRQKLDARIDLYLALGGGFSASALDIEIPEIPENTDE